MSQRHCQHLRLVPPLHFSQKTPRLSRGAERSFMNNLRSERCSDSSLYSTLTSPHHQGTLNCNFQALNFHCLGPRSYSSSSSNTSPPFSTATSSLHLQLVLIFSNFYLLLETRHRYPHTQTWQTCRLSSLFSPNLSYVLYIQTLRAPSSQSPLLLPRVKNVISPTQAGFRPDGRFTIDQVLFLFQSIWDGFQKKSPPDRTALAPLILLRLLIRSGTQLSFTNY